MHRPVAPAAVAAVDIHSCHRSPSRRDCSLTRRDPSIPTPDRVGAAAAAGPAVEALEVEGLEVEGLEA